MAESLLVPENEQSSNVKSNEEVDVAMETDVEGPTIAMLADEEVEIITTCLEEITKILSNADNLVVRTQTNIIRGS